MQAQRLIPEDFDKVAALLRLAHLESKYCKRAIDEARAAAVVRAFLSSPALFARGIFDGDRLAGAMFAEVADTGWWAAERVATSMFLYVRPEYRGHGAVLLRAFLRWAKRAGAARVNVGVSAGIVDQRAGALMTRLGLHQAAVAFEKEL